MRANERSRIRVFAVHIPTMDKRARIEANLLFRMTPHPSVRASPALAGVGDCTSEIASGNPTPLQNSDTMAEEIMEQNKSTAHGSRRNPIKHSPTHTHTLAHNSLPFRNRGESALKDRTETGSPNTQHNGNRREHARATR